MINDVLCASGSGPWIYRLPEHEHGSFLRDRMQWVRDLHRKGHAVVVATTDGRAPRKIMSDVPVISWSQSEEANRPIAGFIAGKPGDFPKSIHAENLRILHELSMNDSSRGVDPTIIRIGREQSGYSISRHFLIPAKSKCADALTIQYHGHVNSALRCLQEQMHWPTKIMPPDPHELEWAASVQSGGWCIILSSMVSDRVYLEAMAAGSVVIGLQEMASRIIRHGINAWLVEAEKVSEAVAWLRSPDQRSLVGALRSMGLATAWRHAEVIP